MSRYTCAEAARQARRWPGKQADRQTGRQTHPSERHLIDVHRQTDTHKHTDRHTYKEEYSDTDKKMDRLTVVVK